MNTPAAPLRALGYVRVSTQEQAEQGISLDAQRASLTAEASRRGWTIEVVEDVASGASPDRGGLQNALSRLDQRDADVLLVHRLDRLTRSVQGFHAILERARARDWQLVIISPGIDTTEPTGRFATSILACAAQYERDLISQRTKEALAHRKAAGGRLGRPRSIPEELVQRIHEQRAAKMSFRAIAEQLNAEGVPTAQGGARWHASTVSTIVKMYGDTGVGEVSETPAEDGVLS